MNEVLKNLIKQRDDLEAEAEAIAESLNSPGPNGEPKAGIKDPLVDSEGFPRNDINVHEVRIKRNRLAIINTDHKNIMKQIEVEVNKLHSTSSVRTMPEIPKPNNDSADDEKVRSMYIPFAKLDEVQDGSPAMTAGICDDDLLVSFGGVDISTANPLSLLPNEVRKYNEKPMDVVVLRGSVVHKLTLTPHAWSGRGLIGCHFTPL